MSQKFQIIVLTRNIWLFRGISALFPEVRCFHMRYEDCTTPHEMELAVRTLVLVDCMIFLSGVWDAFKTLETAGLPRIIIWLVLDVTGKMFPAGRTGDRILVQKQPAAEMRQALRETWRSRQPGREVKPVRLTETESLLLPWFMSRLSVQQIADLTGKAEKTLYLHRRKIMLKTGFRQMVFLQFIYQRSRQLRELT